VVIVVVALIVILRASSSGSKDVPSGPWGALISCLQGNAIFTVKSADGGGPITPQTKAVVVVQQLSGAFVAYLGDTARGADDVTGAQGAKVDQSHGPIHYGYGSQTDEQQRYAIDQCLTSAYE
jgi:hypothetical protein